MFFKYFYADVVFRGIFNNEKATILSFKDNNLTVNNISWYGLFGKFSKKMAQNITTLCHFTK